MKKTLFLLLASLFVLTGIEARAQRIENSSHSTIGYIQSNGRVENSSHSTIGYYSSGIKTEWVVFFFFFTNR